MKFLRIANPGIADVSALTILGVGTTRNSHVTGTIGAFGSGSKLSTSLLLRNNLSPVIIADKLQLHYDTKSIEVNGQEFKQVVVKYKGSDLSGKNRSKTEDLGYTLEWGTADWNDLTMAPREFVSNAIDGTLLQGRDLDEVEIELTNNIRAQSGYTQVYIPTHDDIYKFYTELDIRFLHFNRKDLLNKKLLPKIKPEERKVRIYKNGVLVALLEGSSVWDYNLGDELRLDESRNASDWAVKHAIATVLSHADVADLAKVIKEVGTAPNRSELLETHLTGDYLKARYDGNKDGRKKNWQDAFVMVAGENGVASSGLVGIASHLVNKGRVPFVMPANWMEVFDEMEVLTENKFLSKAEKNGEVLSDPSPDMITAVNDAWNLLETYNMTNGKEKPPVKSFVSLMNGGSIKLGEYRDGTVMLHQDIGNMSTMLRVTALEELVHHTTQVHDNSRDIQDFLFRLIAVMVW